MLESAWLFVGCIAFVATVGAVLTDDDGIAIVGGVLGFITWGIWAFGTLNVVVVGDSVTYTFEMPSLTLLGVGLAILPGYIALTGPVEIISRVDDTRVEDI